MPRRPPKPADMSWLSPYLTVRDADAALAFYEKAFGFEKKLVMPGPDGKAMHTEVRFRDSVIMFGPEQAAHPCQSPATSGVRSPVGLYLYCDDVDAMYKRATAAGAATEAALEDKFYGDRVCGLRDPDGHIWYFATNVADFDPAKAPH